MIAAIHQPNFFPWLGYFNKIAMCDTFVVLDHVEAMWRSTWLTRNRVLNAGQPRWLTLPAHRSEVPSPPPGCGFSGRTAWWGRTCARSRPTTRAIRTSTKCSRSCGSAYEARPEFVAELNLGLIAEFRRRLGLDSEMVRSSDLVRECPQLVDLRASDLLIAICKAVGADEYLCGEGSLGYIDPAAFESNGIAFWFQRFAHPGYQQSGSPEFVSHLSVLDALFNVGFSGVCELLAVHARERVTGQEDPAPVLEAQQ